MTDRISKLDAERYQRFHGKAGTSKPKRKVTISIDPELYAEINRQAAGARSTIRQWIIDAIQKRIDK